jgi:glycosyltransferase involved in cell wall biosynthesis
MAARADPPLAVVIPAYQAADTVRRVIADTRAAAPAARVIVVDDGSTDGTAYAASAEGATIHRSTRNRGKGAALATGVADAVRGGAEWIVTLDADGQHVPSAIPRLVAPLAAGQADLVLGARFRGGTMPLSRRGTNWLSSVLVSRVAGYAVPDAQTGFRAFTRAVAERVRPGDGRYEWELAFLLGSLGAGFRVASIDVPTLYGAPSHFRAIGDTWRMMRVFARHGGPILRGKG